MISGITITEKPIWLLFDWGDTLMRVFPEQSGPMISWPQVEAMPGAVDTLRVLSGEYHLALATNAEDSDEDQIRAALDRVGLGQWIEQIFGQKRLGKRKPEREYFLTIAKLLNVLPSQMIMIGDSFTSDIQGAVAAGLWAIWLNRSSTEVPFGQSFQTVHSLEEILSILKT